MLCVFDWTFFSVPISTCSFEISIETLLLILSFFQFQFDFELEFRFNFSTSIGLWIKKMSIKLVLFEFVRLCIDDIVASLQERNSGSKCSACKTPSKWEPAFRSLSFSTSTATPLSRCPRSTPPAPSSPLFTISSPPPCESTPSDPPPFPTLSTGPSPSPPPSPSTAAAPSFSPATGPWTRRHPAPPAHATWTTPSISSSAGPAPYPGTWPPPPPPPVAKNTFFSSKKATSPAWISTFPGSGPPCQPWISRQNAKRPTRHWPFRRKIWR